LTVDRLELRPVVAADEDFLLGVYGNSRARELERVPWDETTKRGFLQMQFAAQQTHNRSHFPRARHDVILADGVPAGRLYVDRREQEIRILDLALLPEARGRGIESRLLKELMEEAKNSGKAVSIYLDPADPSRESFEGVGFVVTEANGFSDLMEWNPSGG
jgi:ribosomal protein S18 acetylase RimI-like enzyme